MLEMFEVVIDFDNHPEWTASMVEQWLSEHDIGLQYAKIQPHFNNLTYVFSKLADATMFKLRWS